MSGIRKLRRQSKRIAGALCAITLLGSGVTAMASGSDYILFLPSSGVISYEMDENHLSDDYSTDDYSILLYKPGDIVSLGVDTDQRFFIENAMETNVYASYENAENGSVSFIMPDEDILFVVKDEEGNTIDLSEIETTQETAGYAEDSTVSDVAFDTGVPMNMDQGLLKIILLGNIKANIQMVDGTSRDIETSGIFETRDQIDLLSISSDGGNWNNPGVDLYNSGNKVSDTSGIILSTGGWSNHYTIDLKNGWNMPDGAWTLVITEEGYVPVVPVENIETADIMLGGGALLGEQVTTTETEVNEVENSLLSIGSEETVTETEAETEGLNSLILPLETEKTKEVLPDEEVFVSGDVLGMDYTEDPVETSSEDTVDTSSMVITQPETALEETEVLQETETEAVQDLAIEETETEVHVDPVVYAGYMDPDIPSNYVPVPNRENMFMVLNDNGEVENYQLRVKVGDTWEWQEVIPEIVDISDADNLYIVKKDDGSLGFFKYSRNSDGTYLFMETDESGNPLS